MDSSAQNDRRIDYIEFPVADIARAKAFYSAAFGWKFEDFGPEYSSFSDGRLSGGLRLETNVTPGGVLVVLYAVKILETRDRVAAAGGRIKGDLHHFPGGCRFYFLDPAGHELAVWSEKES